MGHNKWIKLSRYRKVDNVDRVMIRAMMISTAHLGSPDKMFLIQVCFVVVRTLFQ